MDSTLVGNHQHVTLDAQKLTCLDCGLTSVVERDFHHQHCVLVKAKSSGTWIVAGAHQHVRQQRVALMTDALESGLDVAGDYHVYQCHDCKSKRSRHDELSKVPCSPIATLPCD